MNVFHFAGCILRSFQVIYASYVVDGREQGRTEELSIRIPGRGSLKRSITYEMNVCRLISILHEFNDVWCDACCTCWIKFVHSPPKWSIFPTKQFFFSFSLIRQREAVFFASQLHIIIIIIANRRPFRHIHTYIFFSFFRFYFRQHSHIHVFHVRFWCAPSQYEDERRSCWPFGSI